MSARKLHDRQELNDQALGLLYKHILGQKSRSLYFKMPDYTGYWKMLSNNNFEEYLKALGKFFFIFIFYYYSLICLDPHVIKTLSFYVTLLTWMRFVQMSTSQLDNFVWLIDNRQLFEIAV